MDETPDTKPYRPRGTVAVALADGTVLPATAVIYDMSRPGFTPGWGAHIDPVADGPSLEPVSHAGHGTLIVAGSVRGDFRVNAFDHETGHLNVAGVGEPPQWPRADAES
ncbi:hypothetical protein [Kitasatospora sp. KL5]|uniref:hypothetical protein n=1 Tax=Kitasatospora sp. KL5 TaxID=3425125 RepID=UPI003D6EED42